MKVACLQFNPSLGEVEENMRRADKLLDQSEALCNGEIDWLILPEMAFSGEPHVSLSPLSELKDL